MCRLVTELHVRRPREDGSMWMEERCSGPERQARIGLAPTHGILVNNALRSKIEESAMNNRAQSIGRISRRWDER